MKGDKRTILTPPTRPPGAGQKPPRPAPLRLLGQRPVPLLGSCVLDGPLQQWFDEEVEALQRLAHTQRLKGDYVAAQALEREIRMLAAEMRTLIQVGDDS